MSENNTNVPKIRFPGFTDAWEQRRLGDYTKLITKGTTPKDKSGKGDVNFVKVENIADGKISPVSKISEEEHENYLKRSKLEANDILFSIAGTLGRTAIVDKSILPANTNQALAIIRGYEFDTDYLITVLGGRVVSDYIRKNPTVGAQPNLSLEQVGKLMIDTPSMDEQIKIGAFFKKLDQSITLHQRKLNHLQDKKKGLLEKMFPKNGEDFPELRFPGFTDAWEQRKLGDVADFFDEKRVPIDSGLRTSGEYPYYGATGVIDYVHDYIFDGEYVLLAEDGANITMRNSPIAYLTNGKFWLNNHAHIMRMKDGDNKFLLQLLEKQNYIKYNTGTAQAKLNGEVVKKMILPFPSSKEQKKIGSFFANLGHLITLHQRKLNHLQERKRALLQQMFV